MKNKILFIVLIIFSATMSSITCYADTETKNAIYVYDNAEILTNDEENALQRVAKKYEEYEISVVFLTTKTTDEMTTSKYIEKFYNQNDFYPDGVVFFLNTDIDNSEAYVLPLGKCIDTLSNATIEDILEEHSYLAIAEGRKYEFFSAIEKDASDFIIKENGLSDILIPTKTSIAITIISVIGLVVFLITKHNAANKKPKAQIYLNQTFEIVSKREVYKGDRREVINGYYKTDNTKRGTGVNIKIGGKGRRF